MAKKSEHGGVRPNSGRKPVKDKKIMLPIYVAESVVNKIGKPRAQIAAAQHLETIASKLQK